MRLCHGINSVREKEHIPIIILHFSLRDSSGSDQDCVFASLNNFFASSKITINQK